jgi:predicted nuclease of predicted toxin-antitoxin system
MKFLIDAQLPRRLLAQIQAAGFEAIHTLDLPEGNRTSDRAICELSIEEHYVVVTKDADFVEAFLLRRVPWKLLLISTGNIENDELESLLLASLERLAEAFESSDFVELDRTSMIIHV